MRPTLRLLFLLPLVVLLPSTEAQALFPAAELRFPFPGLDPDAATPPTLQSQGAPMRGAVIWRVRVQANGSATFSGTGRLAAYHWQVSKLSGCTAGCYWRVPQFDCKLTTAHEGQKRIGCGDFEVTVPPTTTASAIAYVPEGIGLSVTSTVSIEVEVVQQ